MICFGTCSVSFGFSMLLIFCCKSFAGKQLYNSRIGASDHEAAAPTHSPKRPKFAGWPRCFTMNWHELTKPPASKWSGAGGSSAVCLYVESLCRVRVMPPNGSMCLTNLGENESRIFSFMVEISLDHLQYRRPSVHHWSPNYKIRSLITSLNRYILFSYININSYNMIPILWQQVRTNKTVQLYTVHMNAYTYTWRVWRGHFKYQSPARRHLRVGRQIVRIAAVDVGWPSDCCALPSQWPEFPPLWGLFFSSRPKAKRCARGPLV